MKEVKSTQNYPTHACAARVISRGVLYVYLNLHFFGDPGGGGGGGVGQAMIMCTGFSCIPCMQKTALSSILVTPAQK